jgi:aryl-alcohol dehydrogenase-like predicted oxidoreductase
MKYREFGRTGWKVSTISFGAWAIGGAWGEVEDENSLAALHKALDSGVNLFDTADVYGDGRSEQLLAKLKKERSEHFYIITKAGRRLNPHTAEGYNKKNLTAFIERSLKNLKTDSIDLVQLHCPPTQVFYMPEVFGILDDLVTDGKLKYYGVSVEKVEEAMKALEFPKVQSVQIIFNIFRQRPKDLFLSEAAKRQVAVIARVPLSSGMLTGKITKQSIFEKSDHREFNRHGEEFDRGETFSGFDFDKSVEVVEKLKLLVPAGVSLTQFALQWILMHEEITCTIPGAKNPQQVEENVKAAELQELSEDTMKEVERIYNAFVKSYVHQYW